MSYAAPEEPPRYRRHAASPAAPEPSAAPQRDWLKEARAADDAADYPRALYAAKEALTLDPGNAEAWAIRSVASTGLKRPDDAEFEAREAVRLDARLAYGHFALACVLEQRERNDEALHEYQLAAELDGRNPLYKAGIASVYSRTGRANEAVRLMEHVVAEHPGDDLMRAALAEMLGRQSVDSWTTLPDGSSVITSAAQASLTRENAKRALALDFSHDAIRASLRENLAAVDLAERMRWTRSQRQGVYVFVTLMALLGVVAGFGSAVTGGGAGGFVFGLIFLCVDGLTVALYVARHRKPAWQHDRATAARLVREARR